MSRRNHRTETGRSLPSRTIKKRLTAFYEALLSAYGPQRWWPGESATEIVIGAILTQNTNWKNVEKAIASLRQSGLIDWNRLRDVEESRLAGLIRSAGYHNLKAKRLLNFVRWLWDRYGGDLANTSRIETRQLREELLGINGVGPETADSILLYALDRPTFVVDAYTGRIARRHGLITTGHDYEALKRVFEKNVPQDRQLFNEYHALIVQVGKNHCGPTARCEGCPLAGFEHDAGA